MRGTSASDKRSKSLSSYLVALVLASVMAMGAWPEPAFAEPKADDGRAFRLFQEGEQLYTQGKFAEAAEKFREAYALDPNPTLLYNLARAYENQGELEKAAETYREFLERQPDASDRGAIERRIQTLKQQIEEKRALERAAKERDEQKSREPAPLPQPDREQAGPGAMPWIVIGVGGAALLTGGVLRLMAESKHSDAEDDPDAMSADDKQQDAESLAEISGVALIAGGVIAAAGITWLVVGQSSGESAGKPSLSVAAGPGSIALRGRF